MCPLGQASFGQLPRSRELLLEQQFNLAYYLGVTFSDYWDMPVADIRWHINRLQAELTPDEHGNRAPSRGAAENTPDQRAMSGMDRAHVPARLRRFT